MDCTTLHELEGHFQCKLQGLSTCMDIASIAADPYSSTECKESLHRINEEVGEMEAILMEIRGWVKQQKELLKKAQSSREDLDAMIHNLHHMRTNLPKRLPRLNVPEQEEKVNSNKTCNNRIPFQEKQLTEDTYVIPKDIAPRKMASVPCMDYLTTEEFHHVPKYLKGRISYELVNSLVEAINEVLEKKYAVLSKPKKSLGDKNLKVYMKYKDQENKDTKGEYFFTDEDLRKNSSMKYDTTVKSRLTILRHCYRLKEIRGGGITRFALAF